MSSIIFKRIDVIYSCFDIIGVNFKYVKLTIFKRAYPKLAPGCDLVSIPCRRQMGIEGGDLKGLTSSGPILVRKIETSPSKFMKFINVF